MTGASGNLGRELVTRLAQPGVRLVLWGRDCARLGEVAGFCRDKGANAEVRSIELTDTAAVLEALAADDDAGPIGLALLVAGQGDTLPPGALVEDPAQVIRLAHANFAAPAEA